MGSGERRREDAAAVAAEESRERVRHGKGFEHTHTQKKKRREVGEERRHVARSVSRGAVELSMRRIYLLS